MDKFNNFLLIFFFALSTFLLNFSHPLNSDEGVVLDAAWNLYNHQSLYKDFFTFVAPGSFLFIKTSFELFGPNYWSAKFFSIALLLASTFATYQISHILSKSQILAAVTSWLWLLIASIAYPIINYNPHSTFLATISIYFFIKATKTKDLKNYFLSGLILGTSISFLQNKGLILTLFLLMVLIKDIIHKQYWPRSLIIFLISTVTVPLFLIAIYKPSNIFTNLIIWPLQNNYAYSPVPKEIAIFLLLSLFGAVIWINKNLKNIDKDALIVIFVTQLSLLVSIYNRLDIQHILINSFPLLIISLILIYNLLAKFHLTKIAIPHPNFLLIYVLIIPTIIFLSLNLPTFIVLRKFKEKVASNQITQIYAHPYLPMIYFELKAQNPYPHSVLLTAMHPKEAFLENLEVLKKEQPKHVLVSYALVKKFNYNPSNPLDNYINSHYRQIDNLGNLVFLAKISEITAK